MASGSKLPEAAHIYTWDQRIRNSLCWLKITKPWPIEIDDLWFINIYSIIYLYSYSHALNLIAVATFHFEIELFDLFSYLLIYHIAWFFCLFCAPGQTIDFVFFFFLKTNPVMEDIGMGTFSGVTKPGMCCISCILDWDSKKNYQVGPGRPAMPILPTTLWLLNIAMENPLWMQVLMGKSSINGPFSMAMLTNQRVTLIYHGPKKMCGNSLLNHGLWGVWFEWEGII